MKARLLVPLAVFFLPLFWAEATLAHFVAVPVATPTDHPVSQSGPRTQAAWRRTVGDWGENLAEQSLRQRGYAEVVEVKSGVRGIDRVGVNRNVAGDVVRVRIVEVKTHRGSTVARLGVTGHGHQMSRAWLADKLGQMRKSPDPATRQLARDIARFRREHNVPIERLGEVHDINTRTGRYSIRRAGTGEVLMSEPIDRHLRRIAMRSNTSGTRGWARQQRRELAVIQKTGMGDWLANDAERARGNKRVLSARQFLLRRGGPGLAIVGLAFESRHLYRQLGAYQSGVISPAEFAESVAGSGGGAIGGLSGSVTGGYLGIQAGAFGGPFAWLTVPTGGILGMGFGGAGGYYLGRSIAVRAIGYWYGRADQRVQDRLDHWLIQATTVPPD